ncbi:integrase, catalytic region, zinc finger, CCHC-type containing protein [Tanacetum coccineum]
MVPRQQKPQRHQKPFGTAFWQGGMIISPILGYGDWFKKYNNQQGLFRRRPQSQSLSVGQFCDADLEVALWKSTCFVRDLQGNDLLTGTSSVNKSSSPTDNSKQQDTPPTMNIQSSTEPTTPTNVNLVVNNDNQAEDTQFQQDEFINPFCTPVREIESSSRNIDNSNMHTFYQHDFEYRWTKDHPLEQVRRNPSKPVQTRRQLATDPEMCMFALTVSTAEPKTIKEAMADSAWIEAMQEELHQFDRLQERLVAKGYAQEEGMISKKEESSLLLYCRKFYRLRKALYGLKQAPRAWYDELLNFLMSKGFTKGLQIHQSPRGIFINQAKYALEILKKHGMEKSDTVGTPMATRPKLDANLSGKLVNQIDYHSKIGSLMYLTSSRPIYASSNADHAGCIDTRKSTSGGIQFLDDKLVSWMSKMQDCTAMSSAEAETEYQLADMFTKALPEDRFQYLVRRIGMRCLTPADLKVLANESA